MLGKEIHATSLLSSESSSAEERRPANPCNIVKAPHSIDFERVCAWDHIDHPLIRSVEHFEAK